MGQQRLTVESILVTLLARLHNSSSGINGSAVVDGDGFVIASQLPQSIDDERVAGMGAALVAMGETIAVQFQHGLLKRTFIESELGYVTALSISNDAVLVAIAHKDAKPGLVFLHLRQTAQEIARVLGSSSGNNGERR